MSLSNARSRLGGLGLGVEDEEITPPVEEAPASEKVEDTAEQAVMETEEAHDKVEDATEVVEELQEQEAALESLKVALESCVATGGLNQQSAVFFNHSLNQITDRLYLPRQSVSVESYGGATSSLQATNISLEGIKETLTKIWVAIKNAVMRAAKAIADFFAKIFGGTKAIKEKAEKLLADAKKMGDVAGKEISFKSAGKLQTEGKADAAHFEAGLKALDETIGVAYDQYLTKVTEVYAAAKKYATEKDATLETVAGEFAKITSPFDEKKVFSGGYVVKKNESLGHKDNKFAFDVEVAKADPKAEQFEESQKMPALGQKAIEDMLGHVIALCGKIDAKKGKLEESKKAREEAGKALDEAIKALPKEDQPGMVKAATAKYIMSVWRKQMLSPIAKLTSIAFSASRSALVVAEKSIAAANSEAKKDEKKDDKAA